MNSRTESFETSLTLRYVRIFSHSTAVDAVNVLRCLHQHGVPSNSKVGIYGSTSLGVYVSDIDMTQQQLNAVGSYCFGAVGFGISFITTRDDESESSSEYKGQISELLGDDSMRLFVVVARQRRLERALIASARLVLQP